ncbi:hypothetical protein NST74_27515 [Paenibacillus sp. FSL F4-0125]
MGGGWALTIATGNRSVAGRGIAGADRSLAPGGTTGTFAGVAAADSRRG